MDRGKYVQIDYTNWRGERAERKIIPQRIVFDKTEWHPESQWLLEAYDESRQAMRLFTMQDIHGWEDIEETEESLAR